MLKIVVALLLMASLASAQTFWDFTDSPASVRLKTGYASFERLFVSDYSSTNSSSLISLSSSSSADSVVVRLDGVAGDRDIVFKVVDTGGVSRYIQWDHGLARWVTYNPFFVGSNMYVSALLQAGGAWGIGLGAATYSALYTGSVRPNLHLDANTSGQGTTRIGETGDNDLFLVDCTASTFNGTVQMDSLSFDAIKGTIRQVTADYVATLADWQIVVDDTANITLPALSAAYDSVSANTGMGYQLDVSLTANAPCTLFCVGADSLNSGVFVALSRWDNVSVRATRDRWILR